MKEIAALHFQNSQSTAAGYRSPVSHAGTVLKELAALVKQEQIEVEHGIVVLKDSRGNVKLGKTEDWTATSGATWGAFWGLVIGLVFAGPIVGLLGGLGLGALLGDRAYKGMDRQFVKKLAEELEPGDAALFLLLDSEHQATHTHLARYELPVYLVTLTGELEEALRTAAANEEVLSVVEQEAADEAEAGPAPQPWHGQYDAGVPPSIEIPDVLLHHFLEDSARKYPHSPAIIFFDAVITYEELNQMADQFAAALQQDGFQPGDRVSIYMPNCPQYTIAYYGTLKAGGIVVPTNPLYVSREVEHQVQDAGVTYTVVLSLLYNRLAAVREGLGLKKVIVTNIKEYFPFFLQLLFTWMSENVPDRNDEVHRVDISEEADTVWFADFLASAEGPPASVERVQDDGAVLIYTGGTTGVPKGAELTHHNLVANVEQIRAWVADYVQEGKSVMMTALPLSHAYSMTASQNIAIRAGMAQVMIPNPRDLKDVLKNLQKHKVEFFPAVPTLYTAINNHPDVISGKYDLTSIVACISGGAGLPEEVQRRFMEVTGSKLVEGYGLSETSPVASANPIGSGGKIGTIGLPVPNTEFKIVDSLTGTKVLPQGEAGELCVKGPQVMKGYRNMADETANAIRADENGDLWLYTGDIAAMDENGYFKILDRKKDIIIAGGFNIYPNQVEEVLYTHPDILEAAIVGVPDERRGEVAKAFVVLKEGASLTEEDLRDWCKKEMRAYMVPRSVEFRESLPKTMVGKILRRQLAEEEKQKNAAG